MKEDEHGKACHKSRKCLFFCSKSRRPDTDILLLVPYSFPECDM